MNSKMILISVLVVVVFFSTALTPVFADNTGACGIEKKEIIKSIIAYITQKSDISQNQVVFLFKGYLGALNCGNADLVEAKDKADNIDEEIIPKCSDGTMLAHCSHNTPKYCYSGKLIDRCDLCCDSGRCGVNSQCEGEVNIVDCAQEYGSEYFCGTYNDWTGQCQSVGQIKKLAYSRCSDETSATQYCIKCEEPQETIDCTQQYGNDYWCSTYDEWKAECLGRGETVKLANAKCHDYGDIYKGYCSTCVSDEAKCHVHENPSWFEVNDYEIQVIEKGCTDNTVTEYLIELRDDFNPAGVEHCGERLWVWFEAGSTALESGKCYRVNTHTNTVTGHMIVGVGDEINCRVCENPSCHTHTNPTWLEVNDYSILTIEKGCDSESGTEYLVEFREESTPAGIEHCGEKFWFWLEPGLPPLESGKCYRVMIHTDTVSGHMITGQYEISCPVCEFSGTCPADFRCNTLKQVIACHDDVAEDEAWTPEETGNLKTCTDEWEISHDLECPANRLIGDIDGDNLITTDDSTLAGLILTDYFDLPSDLCCIDPSNDNHFDISDVTRIGHYARGNVNCFPRGYTCSATENCDDTIDNNCNGVINEGCASTNYCYEPRSDKDWIYEVNYLGNSVDLPTGWFTGKSAGNGLLYRGDKTTPRELFAPCADKIESIWHFNFISEEWKVFSFNEPGFTDLQEILDGEIYSISMNKSCVLKHPDLQGSFWKSTSCVNGCENGVCTNSVPDESDCHTHKNQTWLEINDYDIQIIEKGCTSDCLGIEYLVELREKFTPAGIEHCGERLWVWLEADSSLLLEIDKCYRVYVHTRTVTGHLIIKVGDEKSCPVCESSDPCPADFRCDTLKQVIACHDDVAEDEIWTAEETGNLKTCTDEWEISHNLECPANRLIGDIDGDNLITTDDSTLAGLILTDYFNLPSDLCCIDPSGDDNFDISDVTRIGYYARGKINCFPRGYTCSATENCDDTIDNNCDGNVNEGCTPTSCHTHTNPAWIEDGTHRIKVVDTGCTLAGCAEGDYNGTEILIELREGAFCGEQVWVGLDTLMSQNTPEIGNCYMAEIFTKMYGPDCGHVIRYLIAPTECLDCDGSVTEYGNRCAEDAECTPPLVCQTSGRYDKTSVYTEEYCCHTNECASVISGPCVSLGGTDIKDAEYPHMTLECVFNNDMQRAEYIVDCGNTFGPEFWCGTYDSWVGQCGSLGEIKELSSPGCSLGNGEAQYCIKCA